jgi:hypothetical protein
MKRILPLKNTPPRKTAQQAASRKGRGPAARSEASQPRSTDLNNGLPDWIDKEELRRRLSLPSSRMVDQLMRKKMIPFTRLGWKTTRFSWARVQAALAKYEQKAIGS